MRCHLCGEPALDVISGFARLPRVTSDCRPWPAGGAIGHCLTCGTAQKPFDATYRTELDHIYADYAIYAQAGGAEQRALADESGSLGRRSAQIMSTFLASVALPQSGRWLDVGCGNGAMLRAVADSLPAWCSVGTELDERNRVSVESIPGVERLHTDPLDSLDDSFDVISMIHVLEHVDEPVAFLRSLKRLLRPGGLLLVELPYFHGNSFDLAIADHATHFDEPTLRACLGRAGLRTRTLGRNFLDRELYAIAEPDAEVSVYENSGLDAGGKPPLESAVAWLAGVADALRALPGPIGVFGSSIGATFAYGALGGRVEFFVDEDRDRVGGSHLGVKIIAPEAVPPTATVYVALPPQLARIVGSKPARGEWRLPPPSLTSTPIAKR